MINLRKANACVCVSECMTTEREVTAFLILKCVIIQRTAVLCLFWTSTDTDGFDHRGSHESRASLSFCSAFALPASFK